MARIIVGVDRSDTARRAFEWALGHAKVGDTVVVVHVWQIAAVAGLETWHYSPRALTDRANDFVSSLLTDAAERAGVAGPAIERLVCEGHAGRVLVDIAAAGDLIVVGSRGLGAFRGMLLGSTSNYVVHHAPCPVAVIRDTGEDSDDGSAPEPD